MILQFLNLFRYRCILAEAHCETLDKLDLAPDLIYVSRKSPAANSMNSVELRKRFGHNITKKFVSQLTMGCVLQLKFTVIAEVCGLYYLPALTRRSSCHFSITEEQSLLYKKHFISLATVFRNKVDDVATAARNKLKSTQSARWQHTQIAP